ncbi:MAG: YbaB/EbfC family nucleoid-associated protein [Acidobacteriales bacterium]|nr:YbaB/EbfC family nucleoid-associated protein [Terriglobales bacterium]
MGDFEAGELGARLQVIASDLEDLSGRLTSAAEVAQSREYRAADPEGLAEVVVDGRPRVTEISLHPDLLRESPDEIDQLLTALLNDALGQAHSGTHDAVLDALPDEMRTDVGAAVEGNQR